MIVESHIFIGIDAGGSKTQLIAQGPQNRLITLEGPGVNLQRDGLEATLHQLHVLIEQALQQFNGHSAVAGICAGIAGASNPQDQQTLAFMLRKHLNLPETTPIHIAHDAHLVFEAAFAGESGLILIAGTGSVVYGRTQQGTYVQSGGWGYLLGDEGGGYALGLAALRAVADAIDGGPPTALQQKIAHQLGLTDRKSIIHRVYRTSFPIQHVAPIALETAEEGDTVALNLVRHQVQALTLRVVWLLNKTPEPIEQRIAIWGGLARSPFYFQQLKEALLEHLPALEIFRPKRSPVEGALRLAEQAFSQT